MKMSLEKVSRNYLAIFILLCLCVLKISCTSCIGSHGVYDLSPLRGEWPVSLPGTKNHQYVISLCEPFNYVSANNRGSCVDSAVCRLTYNETVSLAQFSNNSADYSILSNHFGGFNLFLTSPDGCKKKGEKARASISFTCGPHLGSPELIPSGECQANFIWSTSVACKNPPKIREVPCYYVDLDGNKVDLSYLIKEIGSYVIDDPLNPDDKIYINVCSDISLGGDTSKCPPNVSACKISQNGEVYSLGSPSQRLQPTKNGAILVYENGSSINQSYGLCNFSTHIYFKCSGRLQNRPPRVMRTDVLHQCNYFIEWETEYACPDKLLNGNLKKCSFTKENNGVVIDLSPLKRKEPYVIEGTVDEEPVQFYLNVCGGLDNVTCNGTQWKSIAACMHEVKSNISHRIGTKIDSELKFADGQVFLSYGNGRACGNSELHEKTVINFVCNKNNETGPRHLSSSGCVHLFEWYTVHACVKDSHEDISCSVIQNGKTIDLQMLFKPRKDGLPWEVFDVRTGDNHNQATAIYMNVCGDLSVFKNTNDCGSGTAICLKDDSGNYTSLGQYESSPVYDSQSGEIILTYTSGSTCDSNKKWQSKIHFKCKPGHLTGSPSLVNINKEECLYEIDWYTATACPFGKLSGSNCIIYNSTLGLNFNLNPLRSVKHELDFLDHTLYFGICEAAKNSPCMNNSETINSSFCEVDHSGKIIAAAELSSDITYENGMIQLRYKLNEKFKVEKSNISDVVIIFGCYPGSGPGKPEVSDIKQLDYVFYWFTEYACIQQVSTECTVHDPVAHRLYDLSSLSLEARNWVTPYEEDHLSGKAYINICRPLVAQDNCDPDAAVCVVDKHGDKVVQNAGRAHHRPQISSEGHLQLNFTEGMPCTAFGDNTTYTTVIHFLCAEPDREDNIWFLGKVGACQFTFLWTTKAACPSNNTVVKDECMLTDPDTGFLFDLTSLRNDMTPYSVAVGDKQYQLNICGAVKHGCSDVDSAVYSNASVCEEDKKTGKLIAVLASNDSYTLSYSIETTLTLTYRNRSLDTSGKSAEVVIRFPCSSNASVPKLAFVHKEYNRYIFEMETQLTCQSAHFDCMFTDDKGNEFDLTPLSNTKGRDWVISGSRYEESNYRYHISFCRPLNSGTVQKCSGGSVAACRLDVNSPEHMGSSLGSQFKPPTVSEDGTLVLRYTGGSICENGQFKYSTRITLFCSQYQGNLVFLGRTPECEYLFSMDTPAACPLQTSYGVNCSVAEPDFGYVLNLNSLRQKTVSVSDGNYEYLIRVCGDLGHGDNIPESCGTSAVCQTISSNKTFAKSLGLPSSDLMYEKGVITLKYTSGSGYCHGKYNRSTIITFTCDEHAENSIGKPVFVSEAEDCTYLFEWPTSYACPPYHTVECSTQDTLGNVYDLTALGLTNTNYYVRNPMNRNQTFVLNVCRTVVYTQESRCPYHSGACLLDIGQLNLIQGRKNIGRVEEGPYFKDNILRIKYTNGEPCTRDHFSSARFMETVINFSCNENAVASDPEYVGRDGCVYYFDWVSTFACPLQQPPAITASDCSVTDPMTGFKFSLSSLRRGIPYKVQTNNHIYHLNICGTVKNSPCGAQSGVCQEESSGNRSWNAGKPNSDLHFSDGILYLNYTGGAPCHQGRFERNTIIQFHCGTDIGEPMFLYESTDCTYHFTWMTELACQSLVHCAIRNGSDYFSLAPLSNAHSFTVKSTLYGDDPDAVYFLRVCGPLGEMDDVPCPPSASICRVTKHGSYAENLGHEWHLPFIDFQGHATAIYTNGSICEGNKSERYRSRVIFLCDPSEMLGEPVLVSKLENDCVFIFEWKTSVVCPSKPTISPKTCSFKDEGKGLYFDLSAARNPGSYYEVKDNDGIGSFFINVCDNVNSSKLNKCQNAGVCYQNGSDVHNYGLVSSDFYYTPNKLWLPYKNGDDCMNDRRSSEIFFTCNPTAGIGHPKIYEKFSCLVVFMWETNLVCRNFQHPCTFDFGSDVYDFHLLSSLTHNWNASDKDGNTYFLNLCRGIQRNADTYGCPPSAAVCMRGKDGSHMALGMVNFVKAKKMKMNSSTLVLTYESQSPLACADLKDVSNVSATTRIFMTCGSSLGSPKYISGPDKQCFYDFEWETSLACQDNVDVVLKEENGVLKDNLHEMDIRPILNRTFIVEGKTEKETYTYLINLDGIKLNGSGDGMKCSASAVCQTKTGFMRDIGSIGTRQFHARGSELYLTLISNERSCGKNSERNVTTLFRMQCASAAGIGQIEFVYESGGCDYIFNWDTYAVCPKFHRPDKHKNVTNTDNFIDNHPNAPQSGHNTSLMVSCLLIVIAICCFIGFVLRKPERREAMTSKLRSCYRRVTFPRFRYKRVLSW